MRQLLDFGNHEENLYEWVIFTVVYDKFSYIMYIAWW